MNLLPSDFGFSAPTLAAVGFFGLCLGSFSNVLIYRLPRNRDVVAGRSHCPHCDTLIRWFDNLPLLSWVLLRGRCRVCRNSISPRYPLVEASAGILALLAAWRFGIGAAGLTATFFLVLLLAIALIDWEHMIIPHTLTVVGMLIGVCLSFGNGVGVPGSLLGGAVGAGSILVVSWGYRVVRGQVGMGGGDVMLMGMIGTVLGALGVGLVLFGGALAGTLFALVAGRGRLARQSKLPFGTFLAAAAGVVLFAGNSLVNWYLGFLS